MNHKKITRSLALATCTLLGSGLASEANAIESGSWNIDLDALLYSEVDRVTVFEPVIKIRKEIGDDHFFSVQLAYDTMAGASANGATATNRTQTFTTASGENYNVDANETPTRDFNDQRTALNLEWEKPLARTFKMILGSHISSEDDYTSAGAAATFSLDVNSKLTTITAGGAVTYDVIDPSGGTPTGLALYNSEIEDEDENRNSKNITDVMLGITQVLTRKTLTQLNYTHSQVEGYQTDPYKIFSIVDSTTGETLLVDGYRNEKRPESRSINIIYWKLVHQLTDDVVHFSYRHFSDDWGVTSHTANLKYRFEFSPGTYLQPYYRYYKQSAAEFYRHSITDSEPLPDFVSADYRLGEMTSNTVGIKFGTQISRFGEVGVRVGYIRQEGESSPDDAIGIQKQQDLFPTVEAYTFLLSLKLVF